MAWREWMWRSGVVLGFAGVLAPVLVLAGTQDARAYVGPPKPVALPSSVLGGYIGGSGPVPGSLDSATPLERARAVGNTLPSGVAAGKIPGSMGGAVTKAGGGLLIGATGLQVGWSFGARAASLWGLDSNGALAELTGTKADPSYTPNSDAFVDGQPGWTGDQVYAGTWRNSGGSVLGETNVSFTMGDDYTWQTKGQVVILAAAQSAPPQGGNSVADTASVGVYWDLRI